MQNWYFCPIICWQITTINHFFGGNRKFSRFLLTTSLFRKLELYAWWNESSMYKMEKNKIQFSYLLNMSNEAIYWVITPAWTSATTLLFLKSDLYFSNSKGENVTQKNLSKNVSAVVFWIDCTMGQKLKIVYVSHFWNYFHTEVTFSLQDAYQPINNLNYQSCST